MKDTPYFFDLYLRGCNLLLTGLIIKDVLKWVDLQDELTSFEKSHLSFKLGAFYWDMATQKGYRIENLESLS